jgi:glycine betaine/proline transport system permease protein
VSAITGQRSAVRLAPDGDTIPAPKHRIRHFAVPLVVLAIVAAFGIATGREVPSWLDLHLKPWLDSVYRWTVINRDTNFVFTGIFKPIASLLSWSTSTVLAVLRWLRWPGVVALVALIGLRVSGWLAALIGAIAMTACVALGVWDLTMITLSLMVVSVVVALVIGVPLGIWAGRSNRVDKVLRSILDTAQVMPVFVYLLPIVIALGIGIPSAVVATVVFAIPPAVRLTSLGIRTVPVVSTEVGRSFGSTERQLLAKVQLPLARRTILLGLNQVIMMAFGVVVLAALLGTGGLGQAVLTGLQKVNVGNAFVPGLALVLCAIALDRVTTGERQRGHVPLSDRTFLILAGAVAGIAVLSHLIGINRSPSSLFDLAKPVNRATKWINDNLRNGVPVVGGTTSFSDFLVRHVLTPLRDFFLWLPWWTVVGVAAAIGWISRGRRLAAMCALAFVAIGSLRVWDLAMDTLSQVLVAVFISVLIAIPLGIWSGRSDGVERILRPLLDAAQVMPPFVYLVPVIALFNPGRVPGVIASVIYALPPGIRLISLGLRQVPTPPREAALSFGATPMQELVKVQLPLALKAIMLGVNQTILMVLSMVIIGSLVGAGALGTETIYGLTKSEIGRGAAGGTAIVLLAIVLDRVTQAWGDKAGFAQTTNRGES